MPDGIADHDVEGPLGWTLSDAARRQLQSKADRLRSDPGSPYRTVLELLRPRQLRGGAHPRRRRFESRSGSGDRASRR